MHLHLGKPVARIMDQVGAACAYAIIIVMLATALAPLFAPWVH
jgi:hypothetical protein